MSLSMLGHIDSTFDSIPANQVTVTGGDYDADGIWQDGTESELPHTVNIQPLNERELNSLQIGGERIQDYRKIYLNEFGNYRLSSDDYWEFDANRNGVERYKVISLDNRMHKPDGSAWRGYAKITVVLIDG